MNKNILFKKTCTTKFSKSFNYVDIHCHSNYSDGSNNVDEIIKHAKKLGIGISITDHNQVKGGIIACKTKGIFSIPAIEVTSTNAKDILLYFYCVRDLEEYFNKYVKGKSRPNLGFNLNRTSLSEDEIIDFGRNYNCLIFLAHPFTRRPKNSYKMFSINKKLLKKINGIEIINSTQELWKNKKAIEWNNKIKKCFIAGSDMHHIWELGTSLTIGNSWKVENFLEEIRKKENKVMGYSHKGLSLLWSVARIIKNNLRFRV